MTLGRRVPSILFFKIGMPSGKCHFFPLYLKKRQDLIWLIKCDSFCRLSVLATLLVHFLSPLNPVVTPVQKVQDASVKTQIDQTGAQKNIYQQNPLCSFMLQTKDGGDAVEADWRPFPPPFSQSSSHFRTSGKVVTALVVNDFFRTLKKSQGR